jgi:hypothetical protein
LFWGPRLRIAVSAGAPLRETDTSILASPSQTQTTFVGQRESSRTWVNVIRFTLPATVAVLPTGREKATPGSATMTFSTLAHAIDANTAARRSRIIFPPVKFFP